MALKPHQVKFYSKNTIYQRNYVSARKIFRQKKHRKDARQNSLRRAARVSYMSAARCSDLFFIFSKIFFTKPEIFFIIL